MHTLGSRRELRTDLKRVAALLATATSTLGFAAGGGVALAEPAMAQEEPPPPTDPRSGRGTIPVIADGQERTSAVTLTDTQIDPDACRGDTRVTMSIDIRYRATATRIDILAFRITNRENHTRTIERFDEQNFVRMQNGTSELSGGESSRVYEAFSPHNTYQRHDVPYSQAGFSMMTTQTYAGGLCSQTMAWNVQKK